MSSIVSIDTRGYDISMGPGFLRVGGGGGIAGNVYINGNVGIGTANPTRALDVSGSINASGRVGIGIDAPIYPLDVSGICRIGDRLEIRAPGDATFRSAYIQSTLTDLYILNQKAGPLRFGTNNVERMRIDANGNVGIATTSPTYTLDVDGMFRSRGIVEIARSTANPNFYLEMGSNSIFKSAFIDFHTGTTEVDYDARIIVDGGTGTTGGGNINIHASNIFLNGGLKLKNSNTIKGIACGSVAGGTQTGSVSFGFTFDSIPVVTATINATSTTQVFSVTVNNITTTGFNYVKTFLFSDGFAGGGATSESFLWIAIGK